MPGVARNGDTNSHGGGALIASAVKTYVNGLLIARIGDNASPDSLCPIPGGPHCNPVATGGSATVFAEGKGVHRIGDSRSCGATTVTGSANVFAGG